LRWISAIQEVTYSKPSRCTLQCAPKESAKRALLLNEAAGEAKLLSCLQEGLEGLRAELL
jgi:hypothetical protein